MADKISGTLEIGTNDRGEVVMNLGEDKTGHIIFSPKQARNLAKLLIKKSKEAESNE